MYKYLIIIIDVSFFIDNNIKNVTFICILLTKYIFIDDKEVEKRGKMWSACRRKIPNNVSVHIRWKQFYRP